MDVFATLSLALGASFCAGINLYATVFVLGMLSRYTGFDLPQDLMILEHGGVLGVALGLYIVEFIADKVPAVDSAWDSVHTFIRVPAGVILAAQALGDVPMEWQVISGLVGGTMAATTHATKATARLVAHGTGTSPIVSPVASVVEDGVVLATLGILIANPVLGVLVVIGLTVLAVVILRLFWTVAKKAIQGLLSLTRRSSREAVAVPASAAVPAELVS